MKLTCSRRDLHEAVQIVGRAAATQAPLPVLNHILLSCGAGDLSLMASDSNLSARTTVACEGSLNEAVTAPAKTFTEIVSSLPDGPMELESGPRHTLFVRQGEIEFELKGLPGDEFPSIPVVHAPGEQALKVRIGQRAIRRLLRQTLFAVSPDPTRVQYTGVLFEQERGVFRLVATDGGVRVAMASEPVEEHCSNISTIVPARTVTEFARILKPDSEDPAEIYFRNDPAGPTLASFEANGVTLVSRLIEGQFTPWRRFASLGWTERATVKCADILAALRRMSIVAQDDRHLVQMSLEGESLHLTCQSPTLGRAEETIAVLTEGDRILIALHGRFLSEAIAAMEEEGCRIELTSELAPCVVRPLAGDHFLYVQSPMHLR